MNTTNSLHENEKLPARKKLLLIDTFNFLHRAYHALPTTFKDKDGEPTNAVYGVTSMLINVFTSLKPDYAVAALDGLEPTFRVAEFTGYKAHRTEMDRDLAVQIPKVFEMIDAFGIKKIVVEGYEADDIIGTIAKKFGKDDIEVIIISNDRDLWQLVNSNVVIMIPSQNGGDAEWIGEKEVIARMGFEPKMMIDYKGLRGDPSDNIPGVFGIGEKTAKKLIEEFGTVEDIYKSITNVKPDSLKEKLANCAEQAVMSKKLATIITDVPMQISLEECVYSDFSVYKLIEALKKYNFKSLLRRLGYEADKVEKEVSKDQLGLFT